ncbi:uncharacterized protein LOC131322217 isoform X2 [Rhododendron vialii]|uniref:uncharacterized protein LOC131322217 isoform X2 n=1 Tax=Rhododendron vialii TaxID=182163 RepID=UPI00265E8A90|nr:uncharacterized protein LOC131322217 isoform X2 [Rhododendron vialii]
MKGGRKNLKRAAREETFTLQQGQSIMQVISLRGSNLIEVMDTKGENALALFPAKFQKSTWIKRGSFVVVDDSGRGEAIDSGRKVTCIVSQVLFHEQVRLLQKSPEWWLYHYIACCPILRVRKFQVLYPRQFVGKSRGGLFHTG